MAGIRTIITIEKELYDELKDISKKEERSFSNQVIYLVRKGKEATETQKEEVKD